jgi:catechol 2,3-dioxygenase-like lactoylglutathione lyase family enzyme
MLSYTTVGSNRLDEAKAFYDKLLDTVGMAPLFEHGSGGRVYGMPGGPMFGVVGPYDGEPATIGNGTMVGFACPDRAAVDRFHAMALALGGTCEGEPGSRGPAEAKAYMAYVRDLDGNKLCAMKLG